MTIKLPSGLRVVMSPVFPWEPRKGALEIRCGGAFHPQHVTTRLCLRLMDRHRQKLLGGRVLDVGCGTGVLALAAVRMGASSGVGVDIAGPSVELARRNAAGNGMESVTYWIRGSANSVRGHFDWVVANLPYPILMGLLDDLVCALNTRGFLLLSGFHDVEMFTVEQSLEMKGLAIREWLSGDLSFPGEPPSGSYTWITAMAARS